MADQLGELIIFLWIWFLLEPGYWGDGFRDDGFQRLLSIIAMVKVIASMLCTVMVSTVKATMVMISTAVVPYGESYPVDQGFHGDGFHMARL